MTEFQYMVATVFCKYNGIVLFLENNFEELCEQMPGLSLRMQDEYPLNPLFEEIRNLYNSGDRRTASEKLLMDIIIPLEKTDFMMQVFNNDIYQFLKKDYPYTDILPRNQVNLLCDKFNESLNKCSYSFFYNDIETNGDIELKISKCGFYIQDPNRTSNALVKRNNDGPSLSNEEIADEIAKVSKLFPMLFYYMPTITKDYPWGETRGSVYVNHVIKSLLENIIQPCNLWDEFKMALRKCEYGSLVGRKFAGENTVENRLVNSLHSVSLQPSDQSSNVELLKDDIPSPTYDNTQNIELSQSTLIPLECKSLLPQSSNTGEAAKNSETKPPENECCVCLEEKPRLVSKECGHRCVCRQCSQYLIECPICFKETSWLQIFEV